VPTPTCFGTQVPLSGSFFNNKSSNVQQYTRLGLFAQLFVISRICAWNTFGSTKLCCWKTPWWWYLGAETCRSWHLVRNVFLICLTVILLVYFVGFQKSWTYRHGLARMGNNWRVTPNRPGNVKEWTMSTIMNYLDCKHKDDIKFNLQIQFTV
jgi:hypothetical protein